MERHETLISVLTPTFNRGTYLRRVWRGLNEQTYREFEWIVADDGSTDDTQAILREVGVKSGFPMIVIHASQRIGKARMDNEAISRARGEFILWCDSDEFLLPNALECLVATWDSIPAEQRDDFVGVTALCTDNFGATKVALPLQNAFDCGWNDLAEKYKIVADMVFFTRAKMLKAHPFPEVDFVVPESVVWTAIGGMKTRVIPKIIKIVEYNAPHCISFSDKMEYSRGRAYALAISEQNLRLYPRGISLRLMRAITYLRYCIHGEIGLVEASRLWGFNFLGPALIIFTPIAYLIALKDRWQGKVRKTHREFAAAWEHVQIDYRDMPPGHMHHGATPQN